MTDPKQAPAPANATPAGNPPARRKGLTVIAAAVAIAAMAWGGWHWAHGRNFQTTDNAYAAGNVVQITPQLGGTVVSIGADDTDFVRPGQLLLQLDAADALVALAQAEAQLAQTVREVRALYANNAPLQAQVALREAELQRLEADAARAQQDVERRRPLLASGAVGKEEFDHAQTQVTANRNAVGAAQAAVRAARAQLTAAQAQTEGSAQQDHPNVVRAAAKVREAYLALQRTRLLSPVEGHVAKRGVQLGQRIAAGAPVMTVVALNDLWVDANFKESQLAELRIGQPAELTADVYGDKVTYHGKVLGLGAGTGAAFALLPAQNATGNWIKVVQRVPVRIALDPADLATHPLRVGLSMEAKVDVSAQDGAPGAMLSSVPRTTPVSSTTVYDTGMAEADERIARIVAGEVLPALKALPAVAAATAAAATAAAPAATAARL